MNRKKKILFLDHTPFIGGAQLSLIQHLKKINRAEFEPVVVCSERARKIGLTEKYEAIDAKYYIISFGLLKTFNLSALLSLVRSVVELKKIIREEKADLIFCNTIRADIIGSLAAMFTGIKIIWFIQDYTFPKPLFRLLKSIPKKILYVSQSVADYYSAELNEKNLVIRIWRDMDERMRSIAEKDMADIKTKLGIGGGDFVIGYIGRLVRWKGPQILIEAVKMLNKEGYKNIKCLIIGSGKNQEGDNENELKKTAGQIGLSKVLFTGHQEDIPLYFSILDVFCLTSIEPEPFSSVIVEAMLARKPVIGTDIGGTPEIIYNNRTGLLVRPGDAVDLKDSLIKIISDINLKKKIIDNAYSLASQDNTSFKAALKLEKIYKEIIG